MATVDHQNYAHHGAHAGTDYDASALADFSDELKRLSEVNQELLGTLRSDEPREAGDDEAALLRLENAELRARVEELEHLLQRGGGTEDVWAERQREYEALLEEKSEVIRALHLRIQDMQEAVSHPAPGDAPPAEDLYRLKEELEEERRRLQEDEEAMTTQMREMEMAMARDRAELARQRSEVQRMHADLTREIELASRDPGLRDRLNNLRRQTEAPKKPSGPVPTVQPAQAQAAPPAPTESGRPQQSSGFFRRIFG